MQSWRSMNTDWDIRFYDDKGCLDFVRQVSQQLHAHPWPCCAELDISHLPASVHVTQHPQQGHDTSDQPGAVCWQEFPEYYAAYKALPKNVERSDFFR